jgi:hypothetical protein
MEQGFPGLIAYTPEDDQISYRVDTKLGAFEKALPAGHTNFNPLQKTNITKQNQSLTNLTSPMTLPWPPNPCHHDSGTMRRAVPHPAAPKIPRATLPSTPARRKKCFLPN